jgi:hypothetical protein
VSRGVELTENPCGGRRVDVDEHRLFVTEDDSAVGHIAGGVPSITGPDLTGLISDRELEATREQKAELLVGMMVYLIDRPRWVNGTDQVHVFTRDDLPSGPFVIPTNRV